MSRIVCLMGIDGSGKSTLASKILERLQEQGVNVSYVHAYHEPFLLRPLKWLARLFFMRKTNSFDDYSAYRQKKGSAVFRHSYLSRFYEIIWLVDYSIQVLLSVVLPSMRDPKGIILLDRYIYDTLINVSISLNRSSQWRERMLMNWFHFFPKPECIFLVDLPVEEAFRRKSDIPSIEYLKERQECYRMQAREAGAVVLDGLQSKETLTILTLKELERNNLLKSGVAL